MDMDSSYHSVDTYLHDALRKYWEQLHYLSPNLGISYPTSPLLKYKYPPASKTIVNNISKALLGNPRFYTQVLHIMNKMSLPPPFEEDPLDEGSVEQQNVSSPQQASDESEIETDGIVAPEEASVAPPSRKRKSLSCGMIGFKSKKPCNEKMERTKRVNPSDQPVFDPVSVVPQSRSIAINIAGSLPTAGASHLEVGGFGKMDRKVAVQQPDNSENKVTDFVTDEELRKGRLKPEEISQHPAFKGYDSGTPSSRLYVKNLSKKVDDVDLKRLFGRYVDFNNELHQNTFDVRLLKKGRMRGQAFVSFPNQDIASRALKEINGYRLMDKVMVVSFARSQRPD